MTLEEIKARNENKELLTVQELWDYIDSLNFLPELALDIKELVLIARRAGEIDVLNEYKKGLDNMFKEITKA